MKKTVSSISENFENEKTGEQVEGITIMVDGILKEMFDIIRDNNSGYTSNVEIIQDALFKGLAEIKKNL